MIYKTLHRKLNTQQHEPHKKPCVNSSSFHWKLTCSRHDIAENLLSWHKQESFTQPQYCKAKQKYMCVYGHMSKKSRVGRSALIFFFLTIGKTGNSRSGIWFRYFIFEISGKPSFVLWRVTQFFYLLCSQFRQKASGCINKTLLLIKQQKWLSEFCVKIDRVVSKN